MPMVSILGFPALLTPYIVSRQTVHLELYCYEMQGNLDDPNQLITIADHVDDDFCGSIITIAPMLMEGVSALVISHKDIVQMEKTMYLTPAEFERLYFER